jgi:membrane fusion protein, multidrug efflux system
MTKHSVSIEIEPQSLMSEADPKSLLSGQDPAAATVQPKRSRARRPLIAGASLLALAGMAYFGWQYWTVGRFEVSTDDAYVQADNTTVAPKVSGYLDAVLAADNERVKAGQVLAHIDDRDFAAALDQAKAEVASAQAVIASKQAALETQQSIIEAARATVVADLANETFAEQDNKRYAELVTTGAGTVQRSQLAASHTAVSRADVARDSAAVTTAVKQVALLKADLGQAEAALARDEALQHQAELNLSYTVITAAVDGVVGNRTLRVGQYVQAGTQLMAVVPTEAAYIVANYKETQLTGVRAGQAVEIDVDMFPGVVAHGHVDSVAPASGQEFSLLPPDNATGNFTKIVQRIPVKIILDPGSPLAGDLRPGMSVNPTIDTKAHPQTRTAAAAPAHAG